MLLNSELYYAKLMLFGEYSVINGSKALTVPYGHFKGELSFIREDKYTDLDYAQESNRLLKAYYQGMREQGRLLMVGTIIDIAQFEKDLNNGLYFESNVPQGFGLGSSGALTAAIYAKYALHRTRQIRYTDEAKLKILRKDLSCLEGFFHGTSSGIDPLSCYLKLPLLIQDRENVNIVGVPRNRDYGTAGIFLMDTGNPRKTEVLVKGYMEQCRDETFFNRILHEYIPINNACIDSIIAGEIEYFKKSLYLLSQFQFTWFKDMIPAGAIELWQEGLQTHNFFLKLCGAGGGGFLLGFARNSRNVQQLMEEKGISTVTVYRNQEGNDLL
jgi:mevalonate kinase